MLHILISKFQYELIDKENQPLYIQQPRKWLVSTHLMNLGLYP